MKVWPNVIFRSTFLLAQICTPLISLRNSQGESRTFSYSQYSDTYYEKGNVIAAESINSIDPLLYQLGGTVNALIIDDCAVFMGIGPRISKMTICDEEFSRITWQSPILNSSIAEVFIEGDYLYALTTSGRLYSFTSTHEVPHMIGNLDIGFWPLSIFVRGHVVYVVGWTEGITAVDISNGSNPRIVSRYNSPTGIERPAYKDVIGSGDMIYVLISDQNTNVSFVYRLKVLQHNAIEEQDRILISLGDDVSRIALHESFLYIAQPVGKIVVVDISKSHIVAQWDISNADIFKGDISDFIISDDYAFVSWTGSKGRLGAGRIQIFSIETESDPKMLSQFSRDGWIPNSLHIDGKTLLAIDSQYTVYLFNLTDTYELQQVDAFVIPFAGVTSVVALNDELFGTAAKNGLWITKIVDVLTSTNQIYVPRTLNAIRKYDKVMIGVSETSMFVYLIDPNSVTELVEVTSRDLGLPDRIRIMGVGILNDTAVIVGYWLGSRGVETTTIVTLVDLSDIRHPRAVGAISYNRESDDPPSAITIINNILIVAHTRKDIILIDISDETRPIVIGNRNPSGSLTNVYAYGTYVAGAIGSEVRIFELFRENALREVADIRLAGQVDSVIMNKDRLYVASESVSRELSSFPESITVFDISDKYSPRRKSENGVPGRISDIAIDDNYLYLGSDDSGVMAFQVDRESRSRTIFLPRTENASLLD